MCKPCISAAVAHPAVIEHLPGAGDKHWECAGMFEGGEDFTNPSIQPSELNSSSVCEEIPRNGDSQSKFISNL